jgi:hypothetical protein
VIESLRARSATPLTPPEDRAATCDRCGHPAGRTPWRFAALRRPVACGDTQSHEDDELVACGCRAPFHG